MGRFPGFVQQGEFAWLKEEEEGVTAVKVGKRDLENLPFGEEIYMIERVHRRDFFDKGALVWGKVIIRYRSVEH